MKLKFKNKKNFLIIAASVIVLIIIGTSYSLIVHNKNIGIQSESDTNTATVASLRAKLNKLNTESLSEYEQSEYDAIKERFEKAVADGDILSAKQELKSLKELCNSSTKTDTLLSGVVESTLDNEDSSTEVNVGEGNSNNGQTTEVESNTGNSLASSNSSTNSSSSNNGNTSSNSNKNNTSSSSSSNSSSSNTKPTKPNSGNSSNSNAKPTHIHSWVEVYKDIYHQEEGHYENVCVKDAWTESVPVYTEQARDICNGCGKDITNNPWDHIEEQALAGNYACGGYHTEYKRVQTGTNTIKHDAIYEKKWIVTKPAWTEKVLTGYKCTDCGDTK